MNANAVVRDSVLLRFWGRLKLLLMRARWPETVELVSEKADDVAASESIATLPFSATLWRTTET